MIPNSTNSPCIRPHSGKEQASAKNKQTVIDAKRANEEMEDSDSDSSNSSASKKSKNGEHDHSPEIEQRKEIEKCRAEAASVELERLKLQLATQKALLEKTQEAKDQAEVESDTTTASSLSEEDTVTLRKSVMDQTKQGLAPSPDILEIKKYSDALSELGLRSKLATPIYNTIWGRHGFSYWRPKRMTAKEFYGNVMIHSLDKYLPASINLKSEKGRMTLGANNTVEVTASKAKALRFSTIQQITAAIFRRANAMLRNPVTTSLGYVPPKEKGAFLEYSAYLHHLTYTMSVGGLVEFDRLMMNCRKDGEWLKFGIAPTRITRVEFPPAVPMACSFCEDKGHTADTCTHRDAECDIPRLAMLATAHTGATRSNTGKPCRHFNTREGCPFGQNCRNKHVYIKSQQQGPGDRPSRPIPKTHPNCKALAIALTHALALLQVGNSKARTKGEAAAEAARPAVEAEALKAGADGAAAAAAAPKQPSQTKA